MANPLHSNLLKYMKLQLVFRTKPPASVGHDHDCSSFVDMRVMPDGCRVLCNGHLGLPCRAGRYGQIWTAVVFSGRQKAVPVRADGVIKNILHFGGRFAVLHLDGRTQIRLIEPGGRHAGTTGKGVAPRRCRQRWPPRRPLIEKRRHDEARLRRLFLRKGASDWRLGKDAGGQDRGGGQSQELASFDVHLSRRGC
jgi:hypothetical protein